MRPPMSALFISRSLQPRQLRRVPNIPDCSPPTASPTLAAFSLEIRSRSCRVLLPQFVATVHPSILPGPENDRVRIHQPDAVRRPESEACIGPPPGRAGADDGGAGCIRSGNLSDNTR